MNRSIELSNKNCFIYVNYMTIRIVTIISAEYSESGGWLIEFFDDRGDYRYWKQNIDGGILLAEVTD